MTRILLKGAIVIPVADELPDYFTGDILIQGDRIAELTLYPQQIAEDKAEQVIKADNLLVLPGLINTHCHAAMTLFRSYADDLPLKQWLEEEIWPVEEHLMADDIYWGTMLALTEMIRGGTTTFTDMYFFMDRVAEAVAESGIRAVLSRGMIGLSDGATKALQESAAFIDNWHGAEEGRISVLLGPHAPYTCPPPFLKQVIDLAARTGRPLKIHISETRGEVEDSVREHGLTPPKLLYNIGFFDLPVLAAHCVHVTDEDIELLAEKNVAVAHNPGSNLKLGSGIAPLAKMLARGIKVGIGTDGASSNNNLDMIEEMRLASLLAKGIAMDPTMVNAAQTIRLATSTGAKAVFLEDTGSLKVGWKADLIGLRCDRAHLTPMHDPLAQTVYAASAGDVDLVMVNGKILLEKGELKTLDEEKIRFEASRCAERLVQAKKEKEGDK